MKSKTLIIDVIVSHPPDIPLLHKNAAKDLEAFLNDGYEIISAVPLSNHDVAGVEYIVRKVFFNENE